MSRPTALVAMSGGVDSSVAAAVMRDSGYDVVGVTLKLWGGDQDSGCCSVSDVEDARRVAAQLDIPHYVFNYTAEFERNVVAPFVDAYGAGHTPNPCVECNRHLKFGALIDRADELGFETVATGHHAQVVHDGRAYRLRRGADLAKDQSYVLYMLGQRELARTQFPIGHMTKAEVRAAADALGLRTATKVESMDVCFVKRGQRRDFVTDRLGARPGRIVDVGGDQIGEHDGVAMFTVGQRRGIGVATGERRYVVDVDAPTATVTIGRKSDLLRTVFPVRDWCWVDAPPRTDTVVWAQPRAHGVPFAARVDGDCITALEPVTRVAPGQVIAVYENDELLGGAIAS